MVRGIGAPDSVNISAGPGGGRVAVVAYSRGPRAGIYTFTGDRLISATVAPPNNEFVWDLTAGGRRVANGAYIVIVQVDGRVSRQRLFVTRSRQ